MTTGDGSLLTLVLAFARLRLSVTLNRAVLSFYAVPRQIRGEFHGRIDRHFIGGINPLLGLRPQ